jgi:glycine cleavage system H lipoate-binding protein
MRCPYLREAQVKFCRASAYKKLIVRSADAGAPEKCASPAWSSCGIAKQHAEDHPSLSHCPFLHEMLTQYCFLSPSRTYVPYSDSNLSRCGNEGHKYCETYMSLANAGLHPGPGPSDRSITDGGNERLESGLSVPSHLFFARNHMWLDRSGETICHVGIDALLAWAIGWVDRITFLTTRGRVHPTAVLTVGEVDLHMAFCNEIDVTGINMCLRSRPEKITSEPYGLGWLFKGVCRKDPEKGNDISDGLLRDKDAGAWMAGEMERMTAFVHDRITETRLMPDGGMCARGFMREMNREGALRVYNEFFSPYAEGRVNQ